MVPCLTFFESFEKGVLLMFLSLREGNGCGHRHFREGWSNLSNMVIVANQTRVTGQLGGVAGGTSRFRHQLKAAGKRQGVKLQAVLTPEFLHHLGFGVELVASQTAIIFQQAKMWCMNEPCDRMPLRRGWRCGPINLQSVIRDAVDGMALHANPWSLGIREFRKDHGR